MCVSSQHLVFPSARDTLEATSAFNIDLILGGQGVRALLLPASSRPEREDHLPAPQRLLRFVTSGSDTVHISTAGLFHPDGNSLGEPGFLGKWGAA